jgi:hypothetical protein
MKKSFILAYLIMLAGLLANAQQKFPIDNDTVVIIIDTTHTYVEFIRGDSDYKAKGNPTWNIGIKGHYFDKSFPSDAELARVDISYFDYPFEFVTSPYTFEISRKQLFCRFDCVGDSWMHEQTDQDILQKRVAYLDYDRYNFAVFKDDLINDTVTMYRVLVNYNIIVE